MNTTAIPETHAQSAGMRWRLNQADSRAEFRVPHFWGLVTIKGHFNRLDGWLDIDENQPHRMELSIDVASLDTGNRVRDKHLRSAAFFDTEHHPEMHFRSTSASDAEDGHLHVEGELEAAGNTVQLKLDPTLQQAGEELTIDVTTTLDQRKLRMTWNPLGMTKTPTTLTVHAHLRQER
jgi:polyisoprenoid-binding protein YceI